MNLIPTLMEFLIILIAHSICGIYSSTLKYSKKITYFIWGMWVLVQGIILCIAEFVITVESIKFFMAFVFSLVGQYVIFFLTTKGKRAQRVFTMLTYSVFFCIFSAMLTVIKGSFPNLGYVTTILIQIFLCLSVMYYFLGYVCPLCRTASQNIKNGWYRLIFVNIIFLITLTLSAVFPMRLVSYQDPAFITFVFLCISIVVVYPVIFSNINSMSEVAMKREIEQQNQLLLMQIEMEQLQIEADSHLRHDRRHHNMVLYEFANRNDIESIKEYLSELIDNESLVVKEKNYCDNRTMNTVLSVYEKRALEKGISVNISVSAGINLAVSPKDLVVIISNLFENAIKETERLKNKEKWIDISVKESARRLLIKVENACRSNLNMNESVYGIGIRSVIATTRKYDGMYDFTAENDMFSVKISLNI